ncbi:hypothetical protein ACIOMM_31665 [Streptomyces sp. NPDC087908]|uniref:hypothetical protein n=1 Tax=unclassified Streptomyces TaxID=2593676 RepID=UPI00311D4095
MPEQHTPARTRGARPPPGARPLLAALVLPRLLDRVAARTVMVTGAGVLTGGTTAAVVLIATGLLTWTGTAIVWSVIGVGMALVITPTEPRAAAAG